MRFIFFTILIIAFSNCSKEESKNSTADSKGSDKNVVDLIKKAKSYNKVGVGLLNNEPEKAFKAFKQAMEIDPRIPDYPNNAGVALLNQKKYKESIPYFQKSVEITEKYTRGHYNLGVAYQNSDQYAKAIEAYSKAIKLSPKAAEIYYNLAMSYEKKGDKKQAVATYKKFISLATPNRASIIEDAKKKIQALQ